MNGPTCALFEGSTAEGRGGQGLPTNSGPHVNNAVTLPLKLTVAATCKTGGCVGDAVIGCLTARFCRFVLVQLVQLRLKFASAWLFCVATYAWSWAMRAWFAVAVRLAGDCVWPRTRPGTSN